MNHPDTLFQQAFALHQQGQFQEAARLYQAVLSINPTHVGAHINLGGLFYQLKQFNAALTRFDYALSLDPNRSDALHNRGATLHELGRFEEALASYERAISLNSNSANSFSNRCYTLYQLGRLEQALESGERAQTIAPHLPEVHFNLGVVLHALGRYDEAIDHYAYCLKLSPENPKTHWNFALLLLLKGDFERGWEEYEWRWKNPDLELFKMQRSFTQPLWRGHVDLSGKTILLHAEQGFGDTLQFCRYASLLAYSGARVILEVQAPLQRLLSSLPGISSCIPCGNTLPPFDYHCPLLSLPLAFQSNSSNLPAAPRYLFTDPVLLQRWKTRLGPQSKPRIGIVWQGFLKHHNDSLRSVPLQSLLTALPDHLEYVSLQKDMLAHDRETLRSFPSVRHFESDLADFSDTAALCECMDLIVSVDTSVAHLAGALGRPLWLLLPEIPDWRWLLDRTDSPWYPSATLYRQPSRGNWACVLDKLRTDLLQRFPKPVA